MDNLLREKTELMIDNYSMLKGAFPWENTLVKHFGAIVNANYGKKVDTRRIEEIKHYIKENTSIASYFRGTNTFVLANLLSLQEDYISPFKNLLTVYELMKKYGFRSSIYLPLAAYAITKEVAMSDWDFRLRRMEAFYKNMKSNHFWLTSPDDYVFAAVLATTDMDVDGTSKRIENCYSILNSLGFYKGNDLQTLSHVLALGEAEDEGKCRKARELFTKLKNNKCKFYNNGLAVLGVLVLINDDVDKIVADVVETYERIKNSKGYGMWSIDASMRSMLAATLVSDTYVKTMDAKVLEAAVGNSINAIIIAQQQAMIAAACAAMVAAQSSGN